jgi:aminomuconate-semialdehyde/2-hydroxymuconate-6-semialdehyde dehydrogenase
VSVAARNFIDGAFTSGSGNRSFENFTPVDGTSLCLVPEGGEAEVAAAVAAARAALTARGAPWP